MPSQEKSTKTFHSFLIAAIVIFFLSERMQAQTSVIGTIDLYGLREVAPTDIRSALKIKVGDSLDLENLSKKEILRPLLAIPGVKNADTR
jgi:outer membrane protein assembly factor BamA